MDILATEHEQVIFRQDKTTGLRAIIAIHDTTLGPAAGGCRHWVYDSETAALTDALRLSSGMTFKNALADIPFGGGKSVILGEPGRRLTEPMLERFGTWINEIGGRYVTAEDVGMRVADMRVIARQTDYVSGLGDRDIGGDPSPATALGVYIGMQAAVRVRLGAESLKGVRVAVQGLGNVGIELCRRLSQAGAELFVTDIDPCRVDRAVAETGATPLAPDVVVEAEVDVFAPCALGGVLNEQAAARIKARVVAGSANNQLATPHAGDMLAERGILYAPDFVINAGGVISVAAEYLDLAADDGQVWIRDRINGIPDRLTTLFDIAALQGQSTEQVARSMAREVLAASQPNHPRPDHQDHQTHQTHPARPNQPDWPGSNKDWPLSRMPAAR